MVCFIDWLCIELEVFIINIILWGRWVCEVKWLFGGINISKLYFCFVIVLVKNVVWEWVLLRGLNVSLKFLFIGILWLSDNW